MKPDYWRFWELRTSLLDGVAAYMEHRLIIWLAITQAIVLIPISFGVWFLGRCVFLDTWQSNLTCDPYPALGISGWSVYLVSLLALSLLFAWVHRATLRKGWRLYLGSASIRASTLLALVMGWHLGRYWSGFMPGIEGVSSFGGLVQVLTPPILVWLFNTHFHLWTQVLSRRHISRELGITHVIRMLIYRYLQLRSPEVVEVTYDGREVVVQGPVDAIDARRIEDIVWTRLPERLALTIRTTLSDEAYWAAYRNELQWTGYATRPIRPPRAIPTGLVVGLVIIGVGVVIVAFRFGPGLSPGISASDLAGFFGVPVP